MLPKRTSLAVLALLWWPALAPGLATDRQQPVYISADRVEINEQTGVSHYIGNVEFRQGSMQLEASEVFVYKDENALEKVVAEGRPVKFRQRPEDAEQDIRGSATRMEYDAGSATLYLAGDAHIWQANDEFSSDRIVYESEKDIVRANGGKDGNGRVRAVIHPKPKEGE